MLDPSNCSDYELMDMVDGVVGMLDSITMEKRKADPECTSQAKRRRVEKGNHWSSGPSMTQPCPESHTASAAKQQPVIEVVGATSSSSSSNDSGISGCDSGNYGGFNNGNNGGFNNGNNAGLNNGNNGGLNNGNNFGLTVQNADAGTRGNTAHCGAGAPGPIPVIGGLDSVSGAEAAVSASAAEKRTLSCDDSTLPPSKTHRTSSTTPYAQDSGTDAAAAAASDASAADGFAKAAGAGGFGSALKEASKGGFGYSLSDAWLDYRDSGGNSWAEDSLDLDDSSYGSAWGDSSWTGGNSGWFSMGGYSRAD